MTKKSFSIYRIIIVALLSIIISLSVVYGNWYVPIISLLAAWISIYFLRNKIKEVVADERDYRVAGKASGLAIKIYTLISVILGMVLYIAERENAVLFAMGSAFLYSACFLMLLYAILFKIYEKKDENA
jgi:uncharacterized membrane protein